jgi:hypothetical protein
MLVHNDPKMTAEGTPTSTAPTIAPVFAPVLRTQIESIDPNWIVESLIASCTTDMSGW